MSHVVRASAALGVLALAVPAGALAKAAEAEAHGDGQHRHALPTKTPKNLSRKCGKSKSATKIRTRRTSRPTKNRVRTVTTYCSGGTRTVFYIKRSVDHEDRSRSRATAGHGAVATATPAPAAARHAEGLPAHAAAQQRRRVQVRRRRLDRQLRRHHALQDRARPPARRGRRLHDAAGAARGQGHGHVSSGDNFLAGLNLRASFQRFDAGDGPFYDAIALGAHRLRRDHDRQPRVRLRARAPRAADRRARAGSGVPFLSANTDFSGEPRAAGAAQPGPDRRLGGRHQGRPEDRHHRRHHAGGAEHLLAAANVKFNTDVARDRQRGGRSASPAPA